MWDTNANDAARDEFIMPTSALQHCIQECCETVRNDINLNLLVSVLWKARYFDVD